MAIKSLVPKNELSHRHIIKCLLATPLQWASTEPITSDDSHSTVSSHNVSHYKVAMSAVVTMSARIVTEYIYSSRAAAAPLLPATADIIRMFADAISHRGMYQSAKLSLF